MKQYTKVVKFLFFLFVLYDNLHFLRMSAEVDRSQQRQDALHAELGAANVHAWTMEHASQVIVTLPDHSQPHPSIPELQEPMECEK